MFTRDKGKHFCMQLLSAQAISERCKNWELITLFNKQSFCINYKTMKQVRLDLAKYVVNPLQPGVAYLYPLKTSENLRFSDVFRGYR